MSALQQIINNGYHCVLDVAPQAVAKLRAMHLYPIFIRIKFKNVKQVTYSNSICIKNVSIMNYNS